jgi:death-on-curing protein
VIAIHDAQLAEHGGSAGVRDHGLLDSALARARNLDAYGEPDAADLAAAYGFGIARNHAFVDGNKRTAFVAVELFLDLNGYRLIAEDAACVLTMLAVAGGDIDETTLAGWVREHSQRR